MRFITAPFDIILFLLCMSSSLGNKNEQFCSNKVVKKLFTEIGIKKIQKCFILKKIHVAYLVRSYIESDSPKTVLSDIPIIFVMAEKMRVKRSTYCCSPACDKFMTRMGNPNPTLIKCT